MAGRMGARLPLLLQPTCPTADDRGISDFLRLAAVLGSARWVELVLATADGAESRHYLSGHPDGGATPVALDAGQDFRADLRLGGAGEPGTEALELLSGVLSATLERHRLRTQTSLLREALDTTSSSILLFDGRGDIVYANPPADRLLSLQTEDELLAETDDGERQPLVTLLCAVVGRVASGTASSPSWKGRLRTADGRVMACEATRLAADERRADAVVVLLQPIGAEPAVRIDAFTALHHLSRRESEILELLMEGATTLAMAERLGISPHTVRDHLKNIYRKTATSSRGELLGMLSRNAAASEDHARG